MKRVLSILIIIGAFFQSNAQIILNTNQFTRLELNVSMNESIQINKLEIGDIYVLYLQEIESGEGLQAIPNKNCFEIISSNNGKSIIKIKHETISFQLEGAKSLKSNHNIRISLYPEQFPSRLEGSIQTSQGDTPEDLIKDVFIGGNCFDYFDDNGILVNI